MLHYLALLERVRVCATIATRHTRHDGASEPCRLDLQSLELLAPSLGRYTPTDCLEGATKSESTRSRGGATSTDTSETVSTSERTMDTKDADLTTGEGRPESMRQSSGGHPVDSVPVPLLPSVRSSSTEYTGLAPSVFATNTAAAHETISGRICW